MSEITEGVTAQSKTMDLLHPLVSWKWDLYMKMPPSITRDFQVVYFNENLYFVGNGDNGGVLICYKSDSKSQTPICIPCPVVNSTLTTYRNKLVLVGGQATTQTCRHGTNKLWSLQEDSSWAEELPPMTTERSGAAVLSTGHHLIVAGGGYWDAVEEIVEVFDGKRWLRTSSPPELLLSATSALLDGEWYVKGVQQEMIFSAGVDALIANAGEDEAEHVEWRELPVPELEDISLKWSSIVAFCGCILVLETNNRCRNLPGLRARMYDKGFYVHTTTWRHVVDLPKEMQRASVCSVVLPSGELVVATTSCVYKASVKDESFQRGRLSIRAFELLQYALSAPSLYQCIGARRIRFATSLRLKNDDVDMYHLRHCCKHLKESCTHEESGSILIQMWIDGLSPKPATWQSLVKVLASIEELASLGRIIEDFLTKPEKGNTTKIVGEEAVVTGKAGVYVSSLKEQLQEARDANKVLKMESQQRMEEKAQELNAAVAERDAAMTEKETAKVKSDAALKKIEELQVQLAEIHQSEVSTVSMGDTPALPVLIDFPGSNGRINIPERIGKKYFLVGIALLNDINGDRVDSIVSQYRDDPLHINTHILTDWIQGRGTSCTWDNLIGVLKLHHCGTLAEDIEEVMRR